MQCVEHMVDFKIHKDEKGSETNVDYYNINARDYFIPTQVMVILLMSLKAIFVLLLYLSRKANRTVIPLSPQSSVSLANSCCCQEAFYIHLYLLPF